MKAEDIENKNRERQVSLEINENHLNNTQHIILANAEPCYDLGWFFQELDRTRGSQ